MPIKKNPFEWAVVGAGPAGIAAVGKLLDHGVSSDKIVWIDPKFTVGDLGHLWPNVSSNTTVSRFIDFLQNVSAFDYQHIAKDFKLNHLPLAETCLLREIVEPLQQVTRQLRQQVHVIQDEVRSLNLSQRMWSLSSDSHTLQTKNVILATGAVPSALNYPGMDVIPFEAAIDKERLASIVNPSQTLAVFGSSHSAIIIVRHLVELGVKKVINFYRSPCRYAVDMGDWILFDNTGLKGDTAAWAREHIDGVLPSNLIRFNTSDYNLARHLSECNQVIYAVGFERRNNIIIGDYEHTHYNPHVGIIGPGLFGLGIAYPELKPDPFGTVESQVGLWKFMTYLNKVMPVWFKYPC